DGMLAAVGALDEALGCHKVQVFQIAVGSIGSLRPRNAVHHDLLVAVNDFVAGQPDHALDEILRGNDRVAKDDDVAALRLRRIYDLLLDDRKADSVREFVDQNEITDFERRSHRRTGYLERLGDERAQKKND